MHLRYTLRDKNGEQIIRSNTVCEKTPGSCRWKKHYHKYESGNRADGFAEGKHVKKNTKVAKAPQQARPPRVQMLRGHLTG